MPKSETAMRIKHPVDYRNLMLALALACAPFSIVPADAGAQARLAIANFDFADTSGEVRSAASDHTARMKAFDRALREEFSAKGMALVPLTCPAGRCTATEPGIDTLASQARKANARYLLVGGIQKMSTLVGWVKLVMVDLSRGNAVCGRLLTYRGDTPEAWRRAGKFAATDMAGHCLK